MIPPAPFLIPKRRWGFPRTGRELRIDVGETPGTVGNSGSTLGIPQARLGTPDRPWGFPRLSRELRIDVGDSPGSVGNSESTLGIPQAQSGTPNRRWGNPRLSRELRIDLGDSPGSVGNSGSMLGIPQAQSGTPEYGWGNFLEIPDRRIMDIQKMPEPSRREYLYFPYPNTAKWRRGKESRLAVGVSLLTRIRQEPHTKARR